MQLMSIGPNDPMALTISLKRLEPAAASPEALRNSRRSIGKFDDP